MLAYTLNRFCISLLLRARRNQLSAKRRSMYRIPVWATGT